MAKQIIWSIGAKEEKKQILKYWLNRNKSTDYTKKLNILLKLAVSSLAEISMPRKKTDYGNSYLKILKDYLILFEEDDTTIYILSIWDTRQDPSKLRIKLEQK